MSLNIQCQQFLRPNGREVVRYFDISVEYQSIYDLMVNNNHRFEMEVLRTNEISITISTENDDLLIEIIDNCMEIIPTIEKMLKTYERLCISIQQFEQILCKGSPNAKSIN